MDRMGDLAGSLPTSDMDDMDDMNCRELYEFWKIRKPNMPFFVRMKCRSAPNSAFVNETLINIIRMYEVHPGEGDIDFDYSHGSTIHDPSQTTFESCGRNDDRCVFNVFQQSEQSEQSGQTGGKRKRRTVRRNKKTKRNKRNKKTKKNKKNKRR